MNLYFLKNPTKQITPVPTEPDPPPEPPSEAGVNVPLLANWPTEVLPLKVNPVMPLASEPTSHVPSLLSSVIG